MNILLTNDDGILAEGINVLFEKLKAAGHSVYMVAPVGNRSGVSCKISIFNDLKMVKYSEKKWSCEGSPADCVIIGSLSGIIPVKIDVVISGINAGGNLGTDIIYSGTCAAARQGVLYHIPGIAFSVEKMTAREDEKLFYEPLAEFAVKNLDRLISLSVTETPGGFVNVNAPNIEKLKGAKLCNEISVRNYNDDFSLEAAEKTADGGQCYISRFCGKASETTGGIMSDYQAVREGYVSVSVIAGEPAPLKVEKGIKFTL